MKILKRLENLESSINPAPLLVLAETPTGERKIVSACECVKKDYPFIKVVKGGNMRDLDLILRRFEKNAYSV